MKPEIRTRLSNALKSGNYSQTQVLLRDHLGFCALGVLIDLFIQDNPSYQWDVKYVEYFCKETSTKLTYPMYSFCKHSALLPDFVKEWAGLTDKEEEIILCMNDNELNFGQIADSVLVPVP